MSKLDQYPASILGATATYHPYRPVEEIKNFYNEIAVRRERQDPSKNKTVLILGSATNEPTFVGVQILLKQIKKLHFRHFDTYGSLFSDVAKRDQFTKSVTSEIVPN